jgi:hypothetical protein
VQKLVEDAAEGLGGVFSEAADADVGDARVGVDLIGGQVAIGLNGLLEG